MKKNFRSLAIVAISLLLASCGTQPATEYGTRADALDASAWESSKWISAVDAPVVTGQTGDMQNNRAADGSSWFVSTIKNEQKVASAKWMTTSLGVYEIYVNGKAIGQEFMKPGYTHYADRKSTR